MMTEERTKANVRVLKLAYGGLLVALGILLPQAFHIFGQNAGMIFFTDTDSSTVCRDVAWTVLWRTDRNSGTSFQFCTDRDATGAEGLFYVCGVDGIRDCDRMDD